MKTRYIDLIEQTFDFPKDEFKLDDDKLVWNDLPLMDLIEKHGLDPAITRAAIKSMLDEQPLPVR